MKAKVNWVLFLKLNNQNKCKDVIKDVSNWTKIDFNWETFEVKQYWKDTALYRVTIESELKWANDIKETFWEFIVSLNEISGKWLFNLNFDPSLDGFAGHSKSGMIRQDFLCIECVDFEVERVNL